MISACLNVSESRCGGDSDGGTTEEGAVRPVPVRTTVREGETHESEAEWLGVGDTVCKVL